MQHADTWLVRNLLATALLVTAVGCTISAPETDGEPNIDPRVTVLPELTGMVVEPMEIRIPRDGNGAVAALRAGDIVVSTVGEGFLREIESVQQTATEFVLATSDAELNDALIDADFASSLGGEGKADTHQLPTIGFAVRDRSLLDNPSIKAKLVHASLSFAPEIDLDLAIADRSVSNFELVMRGRIRGALELDITAVNGEAGPEIILMQSPPAVFYQQLGPLPVVETVTTSVVLKLQATAGGQGRLRIDADALATLEAGLRYTAAGGWDGVGDVSMDANGSIPEASVTFTQLGVKAWLAAKVDVRLYGLVGPFVGAGPQVALTKNLSGGPIDGAVGFRAAAGGGLKFLRFNVPAAPTYDLFDVTRPLL
jgi:hypothetical protein